MTDVAHQTRQKMQSAMAELRGHVHDEDLSHADAYGEPFSQWLLSRIDGMPLLEPVKSSNKWGDAEPNTDIRGDDGAVKEPQEERSERTGGVA